MAGTQAPPINVPEDNIRLRRAYEPARPEDGTRILVDRLWPRGLSKAKAQIDEWRKEIAPSAELRKWFGHDPARWSAFRERYIEELNRNPEAVGALRALARQGRITLVYAARDAAHNDAVVLREVLLSAAG